MTGNFYIMSHPLFVWFVSRFQGTRPGLDVLEEFRQEFGNLFGPLLHSVVKSRSAVQAPPILTVTTGSSSATSATGQANKVVFLHRTSTSNVFVMKTADK